MKITNRSPKSALALETTLLVHGVPPHAAKSLSQQLNDITTSHNATPALIGLLNGTPTVGITDDELDQLLEQHQNPNTPVTKINTANLGIALHRKQSAATTVSTTMELAAYAGLKVFSTGGIGGVHKNYAQHLDISADLLAFTRFPVAVVTSGVKSILDVVSTREALESLGITVVGYQTDSFPAFYLRESQATVDARFDDKDELADFIRYELARTSRGIVIANPIPHEHELDHAQWNTWLDDAQSHAEQINATGRDATPAILARLHEVSQGKTLHANIELVKSNVALGAALAHRLTPCNSTQSAQ